MVALNIIQHDMTRLIMNILHVLSFLILDWWTRPHKTVTQVRGDGTTFDKKMLGADNLNTGEVSNSTFFCFCLWCVFFTFWFSE